MSFIVFILLFTVVCGWLDAKVRSNKPKGVK
jgi:hypothetical protein